MKGKIFSILFALVLVLSFSLVMAAPAAAAVTPVCSLGSVAGGTAAWSTAQNHGGTYSALLSKISSASDVSTYVQFVPNTGVTLADLGAATATPEWSWWHFTSVVQTNHSQMELRFTQPGGDPDIVLDVTAMPLQNYLGTAAWIEQSLVQDTTGLLYYGTNAAGTGYSWETAGGGDNILKTVSGIIAAIRANTGADADAVLDALVLTRVRIELWEGETARTSYIDDATIKGTNYDLEGPTIELEPSSGVPGTTVTVTGSGFDGAEGARIYFDGVFKTTATTTNGTISGSNTFDIPAGKAAGTYAVVVVGVSSSRTASNTFTVPPLAITLDAYSGPPGKTVAVTGSGFTVFGLVNIYFGTDTTPVKTIAANASGAISTNFTVPDKTAGSYTVKAIDGASLNEATKTFTIPAPTITLAPTGGPPGTTVTVTGGLFKIGVGVGIYFDGTLKTTATTTNGTISGSNTFAVPTGAATGAHTVTANDTVNTATATFTVGAAIALSPTSGVLGTPVTVTGSGFTPDAAVTITFGGTLVATATTTAGVITGSNTFDVPDKPAPHVYTVSATDGTNTATATFSKTDVGGIFDINTVVQEIWDEVTALDFSGLETKIDAIKAELDSSTYGLSAIKTEIHAIELKLDDPDHGLVVIKTAIDDIEVGGGGLASSARSLTLAAGASVPIVPSGTTPILGTLSIQSTGTGYDVDVYTGTTPESITVVESGARNASYPVSGFGLRIVNDTRYSMIVTYVVVYHSAP
jgi:hypothetical protein